MPTPTTTTDRRPTCDNNCGDRAAVQLGHDRLCAKHARGLAGAHRAECQLDVRTGRRFQ